MMHKWTCSQDENHGITAEDCIQSLLDGITALDIHAFLPKKTHFYDAFEQELVTACKGVAPKDHRFRDFHSTCDTVFKKLLSEGVGAEVHHHEAFTPEDEDIFWDKGVFATDSPTGLQNAIFYYTKKLVPSRWRGT